MSAIKVDEPVTTQQIDHGAGPEPHAQIIEWIPLEDADRLADHYRQRSAAGLDILADEAKEAARPILAALAAAGFGGGQ